MANFCPNCGAPLTGSPKFCPACGAAIADASPVVPASQGTSNPPVARPQGEPPALRSQLVNQNVPPPQGQPPGYGPDMEQNGDGPGAAGYPGTGEHYVPDEGLVEMFLRHDNRLNRKAYIMRGLAMLAAIFVVAMVLSFLAAVLKNPVIRKMSIWITLLFVIPNLMLAIRRLHDLNRSAWWIIIKFIPGLNILLSCYLLFFKGTEGPNRYGPDPLEGQR